MRKVILSFVLLLLFFGCIKDENELPIETNINNELSVDYVDIKDIGIEIPILNPIIETHKMLALNYSSSSKLRAVKQDVNAMKDVLVVYEEDDPKSYSISFENQSIERFANVVVVNDENDVPQTMVIEYLPDEESVRLYNTGRIGVEELSGTMHVYGSLADYIDQSQEVDHSQTKEKAPLSFLGSCGSVFGFNFGKGSMRGGGRGGSTEVCTLVKTVKACKAGGRGEHGPSQCGVGTGSTTIIRYECTKIYTSSIGSTLSNMVNTIFLNGRCGGSVSPKGNIGINAQFMPVTPCLDALTCAKADALIDELNSVLDTPLTKQQEKLIYEGGAFFDFAEAAVVALENGGDVDIEELYISAETPDDNYVYQGPKQKIPSVLVLSNGTKVDVTFITHTKDGISSNQPVATELVNGLKFALEKANSNLSLGDKITNINIYATTNGKHGNESNHYNSTALDINSINGKRMIETGLTNQIKEFQKAFDAFPYIRENYGPYFNHRYEVENNQWDLNRESVKTAHKNHIHFAIRKP